jgi:UDP-glucose 4-epimerase
MKILFTGASSFTGFWFVKTLATAGHEIICPVTGELDSYTDVRKQRVEKLKPLCKLVSGSPFGSENFLKIAGAEKFDLLCHHAADVRNYKSEDFDTAAALQNNTLNLRTVLQTLKCPVVLTGSVFENDEGTGTEPLVAFSPYGLSKALTFQYFRYHCRKAGLPLGKFVIPNPFGQLEEPRFTAHLMRTWKQGKLAEVKTPDYVRDNIHVDLLAMAYAKFADRVASTKEPLLKTNPSGYAGSQGEFAQRVAREVKARTGWACELKLSQQTDFNEPLNRVNTEPAVKVASNWNEQKAWDAFMEFYAA